MPCNKVAVVEAEVSDEHIAGLLTTAALLPVMQTYVAAKMQEIGSQLPNHTIELRENSAAQLCFRLGGYNGIDIIVKSGGAIKISHTNPAYTMFCATLKQELLTIMTAVGFNLLRDEITRFVQQSFGVEEQFQRPDGTLVINFNC